MTDEIKVKTCLTILIFCPTCRKKLTHIFPPYAPFPYESNCSGCEQNLLVTEPINLKDL